MKGIVDFFYEIFSCIFDFFNWLNASIDKLIENKHTYKKKKQEREYWQEYHNY